METCWGQLVTRGGGGDLLGMAGDTGVVVDTRWGQLVTRGGDWDLLGMAGDMGVMVGTHWGCLVTQGGGGGDPLGTSCDGGGGVTWQRR